MKMLSKTLCQEQMTHAQTVREKYAALEEAVESCNATMAMQREHLEGTIADLNAVIDAANSWRGDIAQQQLDWMTDRSERWQESDAGQAYASWQQDWEADFQLVDDIDLPEIECPGCDVADEIDGLAASSDG